MSRELHKVLSLTRISSQPKIVSRKISMQGNFFNSDSDDEQEDAETDEEGEELTWNICKASGPNEREMQGIDQNIVLTL